MFCGEDEYVWRVFKVIIREGGVRTLSFGHFVRVKCRDQTVVNNLFKLSNLIDKFFIRIKHSKNKQNRVH